MHDESTSGEVVPGGAAKHASAAVDADAYATAALLAEELAEDYELTDLHLPRATSNVSAETTTARVAEKGETLLRMTNKQSRINNTQMI